MGPVSDFESRKVEHPVDKSSAYNLPLTWIYAGTGFCGKAGIGPPQPLKAVLGGKQILVYEIVVIVPPQPTK